MTLGQCSLLRVSKNLNFFSWWKFQVSAEIGCLLWNNNTSTKRFIDTTLKTKHFDPTHSKYSKDYTYSARRTCQTLVCDVMFKELKMKNNIIKYIVTNKGWSIWFSIKYWYCRCSKKIWAMWASNNWFTKQKNFMCKDEYIITNNGTVVMYEQRMTIAKKNASKLTNII